MEGKPDAAHTLEGSQGGTRHRRSHHGGNRNRKQRPRDAAAPEVPASATGARRTQQANGRARRVRPGGRDARITTRKVDQPVAIRRPEAWWSDQWLNTLQRLPWKNRLSSGKVYADSERILALQFDDNTVRARVQGSRTLPYDVTVTIDVLPERDWHLIIEIISYQDALFTAQLLAGELPPDIEDCFTAAYASLYPRQKEAWHTQCGCAHVQTPCQHVAAVLLSIGTKLDEDPFLLLQLRGKNREHFLAMLREQRAAEAQVLPGDLDTKDPAVLEPFRFWQAGDELDAVAISITPPPFPGVTAKRLGRPPFWRSPADPVTRLGDIYQAIAARAREMALLD